MNIKDAIYKLTAKIDHEHTDANDCLKYTQAALNLAHTMNLLYNKSAVGGKVIAEQERLSLINSAHDKHADEHIAPYVKNYVP